MDWTAFALTLKLAFWTCVLILPIAILLARWLAWGRIPGKSWVETLVMLPLVLPPTVLGFYLLVGFAPDSLSWILRFDTVRRAAGLYIRRHLDRVAHHQSAFCRAADPTRVRGHCTECPRGRLRQRPFTNRDDAPCRTSACVAGDCICSCAGFRPHAG